MTHIDSNVLATALDNATEAAHRLDQALTHGHPMQSSAPYKFDPRAPISPLAARLLLASNGFHSHATDGVPASEPFTTRWARKL